MSTTLPDPEVLNAEHDAREALIATLADHPGMAALREALAESEDEWLHGISRTIMKSPKPLDQRKIDYTKGFFSGAQHWLHARITAAKLKSEGEAS